MTLPRLTLRAPAKLNLFLEVLQRRADGYHDLETVMQAISLHDELTLQLTDREELTLHRSGLPIDLPAAQDLCARAARSFYAAVGTSPRVSMTLLKRIPPGSGLGGGSSDAAHVLRGLNDLHDRPLSGNNLLDLASQIGSDVAFFLRGGRALCHGRGERITPMSDHPKLWFVIHVPPVNCPTSLIYKNLHLTPPTVPVKPFLDAIHGGEVEAIQRALFNRLEPVALSLAPTLRAIKTQLESKTHVPFRVTGSGSGFYTVVQDLSEGTRLKAAIGEGDQGSTLVAETVAGWA